MAKKTQKSWTPDLPPKPFSDTRTAAAEWFMTIQNLDGKLSLEQHAEIEADLAQRFPEADMKLARAFVRREGIYANVSDALVDEILTVTHSEGYEILPWREASLRVLIIEFMGNLKSSAAYLTEDAIQRITSREGDKLRGTTKNACQLIAGQRTRLRKTMRALVLAGLYLKRYRAHYCIERIQEDMMEVVMPSTDPDFIVSEFPFEGFIEDKKDFIKNENGMIETKKYNARGRYAFCVATQMLREIISRLDEIDATIDKSSKNWRVNRMALVDLCILRTATYELLYERISAPRILINESVEMAKSYGAERSHNFVNGLLQQICTDNQVSMD
jgi:transcription antitermination factor NusB